MLMIQFFPNCANGDDNDGDGDGENGYDVMMMLTVDGTTIDCLPWRGSPTLQSEPS